jgi:SAM-dependent methyltransferase
VSDSALEYVGTELELFQHADRWKAYWASRITPWVRGDVLEVGAGLGANTLRLQNPEVRSWLSLEPDPNLAAELARRASGVAAVEVGTIAKVRDRAFDCILYIDVLEHIEDDRSELAAAAALLRPGGRLVVLAPAHPFLYSAFDRRIGHYRRYSAAALRECAPPQCRLDALYFLDSVGVVASLCNRFFLRQQEPTLRQILFWDRRLVPVSTFLDPLLAHAVGKSVVAAWVR